MITHSGVLYLSTMQPLNTVEQMVIFKFISWKVFSSFLETQTELDKKCQYTIFADILLPVRNDKF